MQVSFIICGLGNPGTKYESTRHNLGFRVLDALVRSRRQPWSHHGDRDTSLASIGGDSALFVKPMTYMNLSGTVLAPLWRKTGVAAGRVIVVCDDIALPLGSIRVRRKGSDGGHNGLKSVIEELNTSAFPRVRLGIGPVPAGVDASDYVLEDFGDGELEGVDAMVRQAAQCLRTCVNDGITVAMNRFNSRSTPDDPAGESD